MPQSSTNDAHLPSSNSSGNNGVGSPLDTLTQSTSNQIMAASLTTTQHFSKDSISIRIKAKYQNVDILPLFYYQRLVEVRKNNYKILFKYKMNLIFYFK